MGIYMPLLLPFAGWTFILTVIIWAVCMAINKLWMYHGEEDAEPWDEDDHFTAHS